ncbi:MAG: alanine--tRNA ligase-related protein [Christensenellales bacterium]
MTDKLYYADAYLRAFEATVTACRTREDGCWLALDRSAFYPTGGGQPCDRGTLRTADDVLQVLAVEAEEGEVWHRVERPLAPGCRVAGELDWARRFDHMQQHAGEHILAGCLWTLHGGFTHGLHVAEDYASIDVSLPDGRTRLSREEIDGLEDLANSRVQLDAPIRCWFPTEEELAGLKLRKEPAVQQDIRVVAAGNFEACACGGTHPSSTGQIGLIKVLDTQPARGKMRVTFLCGQRAVKRYQTLHQAAQRAAVLLSCAPESLPEAVSRLQEEISGLHVELKDLRRKAGKSLIRELLSRSLPLPEGRLLLCSRLEALDMAGLKEVALGLVETPGLVALLALPGPRGLQLVFCCHKAVTHDMAALLRAAGAKGGGRPDFAQGSAEDLDALARAEALLRAGIGG